MLRLTGSLLLPILGIALLTGCAGKQARFGDEMKLTDKETIAVGDVIAKPDQYNGKYIRVSGEVREVCESKGCWMTLASRPQDEPLFVKFTCPVDHRLIPVEAIGHKAVVEGTLTVEEVSEEEARHMADEAGKSTEEVMKIKGPQKRMRMASPAAVVKGITAKNEPLE